MTTECAEHKREQSVGYMMWHSVAHALSSRVGQVRCPTCGLWLWPQDAWDREVTRQKRNRPCLTEACK
jgi:hypothetical protein